VDDDSLSLLTPSSPLSPSSKGLFLWVLGEASAGGLVAAGADTP